MLSKDHNIIIFTAKARPDRPLVNGQTGKQLVTAWLKKYDVLDYIDYVTHEKPRALCYIDDKAVRFDDWDSVLVKLDAYKILVTT